MARLRTLKPQFFKDPDLAELPIEARMFYAGLWCQADREGRLRDEPKLLKVEIAPWDDVDAEQLLDRLAKPRDNKPGFIIRYQVDGRRYIWIPHFLDHQKPFKGESASRIPPPPGMVVPKHEKGVPKHEQVSAQEALSLVVPSLGSGEDPPIAPRTAGGPPSALLPLRIPKRHRPGSTTLAEEQRIERDRERDRRSRLLHAWIAEQSRPLYDTEQQREVPREAPSPDAQLAWVQERFAIGPPEAADLVALVEQAQLARRIPQ